MSVTLERMDIDEITDRVSSWDGVLTLRPGPGDGSPPISWGDVFFYVAPDGEVPSGQPFATIVTKDYPDDVTSRLDRPGTFRLNIAAGRDGARRVAEAAAAAGEPDPSEPDVLLPHPVYGRLGWVAVVDPGPRAGAQALALLVAAHAAALARWRRRTDADGGAG
jgi:hypothetical protein